MFRKKNLFKKPSVFGLITLLLAITASFTGTAAGTDIVVQTGVSAHTADAATEAYNSLPDNVKNAMTDHGTNYQILSNGDDINGNGGITYLTAIKDANGNYIWNGESEIYINGSFNDSEVKKSVIHEAGHWIDAYVGEIKNLPGLSSNCISDVSSYTSSFRKIYEEEKDNSGWCSYFTLSAYEYYAESYHLYHTNPELLKSNQPQTYEYIKNDISLITGIK